MLQATVTPPEDLTPAIEALGTVGRDYLDRLMQQHDVDTPDPWMLAKAADYGRLHGEP